METLLMVAVILTTLAIMAQAGVLVAMYLLSRRVTDKVDMLINDSRQLMAPVESITSNLKTVSADLAESGRIARGQVLHIQALIGETQETIRGGVREVREMVVGSVDEARGLVMRPIRHYSAMATGIAVGIRTFFSRRPQHTKEGELEEEHQAPAA